MDKLDNNLTETARNFLHEFRKDPCNNAKLVSLNEEYVKTLIARHSDNGYIVISPCKSGTGFGIDPENDQKSYDKLAHTNRLCVKHLYDDISKSVFKFTPIYGGFIENLGTENETNVYERSFIIYNKYVGGKNGNFKDLYDFGLHLCKEYNQDSFVVKAPGENPKYIRPTEEVVYEFNGATLFNDLSEKYFTDLHNNSEKYGDEINRKATSFIFTEAYINPGPQCYSERHVRGLKGEVF